ncbi:hypothetical protein B0H10DRAFT_2224866 [Mycena sp. CBHHK59/15]|nr:hypothetical protein B0H10DRAFT_2224866 [Mycena sp. CBHHK59/15]
MPEFTEDGWNTEEESAFVFVDAWVHRHRSSRFPPLQVVDELSNPTFPSLSHVGLSPPPTFRLSSRYLRVSRLMALCSPSARSPQESLLTSAIEPLNKKRALDVPPADAWNADSCSHADSEGSSCRVDTSSCLSCFAYDAKARLLRAVAGAGLLLMRMVGMEARAAVGPSCVVRRGADEQALTDARASWSGVSLVLGRASYASRARLCSSTARRILVEAAVIGGAAGVSRGSPRPRRRAHQRSMRRVSRLWATNSRLRVIGVWLGDNTEPIDDESVDTMNGIPVIERRRLIHSTVSSLLVSLPFPLPLPSSFGYGPSSSALPPPACPSPPSSGSCACPSLASSRLLSSSASPISSAHSPAPRRLFPLRLPHPPSHPR